MNGRPCPERLLLPEALSAQLAPAEEKRVMAHLETCPACEDAAAEIEIALVSLAVLRADRDDAVGLSAPGGGPVVRPVREPELLSVAVKLKASALPAAGWYECVWIAGGETRSAGSFHATGGAVNVDLRVAAPRSTGGWDLQVLAHDASGTHVVLEGNASYPA